MNNTLKLINGVNITKENCSCLKCTICIKLLDIYITKDPNFSDNLSITQANVYDLIIKHGITKYESDSIIIVTKELIYYIYKG